jgi:hypothetical protein
MGGEARENSSIIFTLRRFHEKINPYFMRRQPDRRNTDVIPTRYSPRFRG